MNYRSPLAIIFTSLLLSSGQLVAKETPTPEVISLSTIEVADNIYMLKGEGGFFGGNVGLSIGDDGAVLIDNGLSEHIDLLQTSITDITKQPIKFLINTHVHYDHTGNNTVYGTEDAYIVAHEKLRQAMLMQESKQEHALPVITFPDQMTFHLNKQTTRVVHFPSAHTDGDAVIHFKEANVIHAGDIFFNGVFPFIDSENNGGSYNGYIAAQQAIIAMADNDTRFIPGHGPLATKQDLQNSLDMLIDCKAIISKLVNQGKSTEEIIASKPLQKYQPLHWDFITTEKMIKQVIEGLK